MIHYEAFTSIIIHYKVIWAKGSLLQGPRASKVTSVKLLKINGVDFKSYNHDFKGLHGVSRICPTETGLRIEYIKYFQGGLQ